MHDGLSKEIIHEHKDQGATRPLPTFYIYVLTLDLWIFIFIYLVVTASVASYRTKHIFDKYRHQNPEYFWNLLSLDYY
jgi:hypothetical protein